MNNTLVYIGGYGICNKGYNWQNYVKDKMKDCNIKTFNTQSTQSIDANAAALYRYSMIKKSDVAIFNLDDIENNIDSMWEVCVAWTERKPVVAFGNIIKTDLAHSLFPLVFKTVIDACDYILAAYSQ